MSLSQTAPSARLEQGYRTALLEWLACFEAKPDDAAPMLPMFRAAGVRTIDLRARRRTDSGAFARFARPAVVNGGAGVVVAPRGVAMAVVGFTTSRGRIVAIDLITDREKLGGLSFGSREG